MALSDRDRIRHLLRRFGLGAGRAEMKRYEPLGVKGTLTALLDDDKTDEQFDISPWEFATQDDGKIDSGAYHLTGWWALRMLVTRRPCQERMTLFWHDHFAVDYEKVYEAPMMAGYLDVLRKHGRGKFKDLLWAVFEQGASYAYLDQHSSNRIHPNENYARELLELFTIGIGNYTEQDVRESARALTGWSIHYIGTGGDVPYEQLRLAAAKTGIGVNNPCYVPALHDDGEKTILGQTKRWDAKSLLEMLAEHPKTAEFICRKLWDWFAWQEPTADTMKRLVGAWKRSDGEIKAVMKAIADAPQFWEPADVARKPKSPIESVISLYRCFDLGDIIALLHGKPKTPYTPVKKELREAAGGLAYLMGLQGMILLLPPNVGGWEWGKAWINPAISIERIKLGSFVFWSGGEDRPMASLLAAKILQDDKPANPEQLVIAMADILDCELSAEMRPVLVEAATKHGGVEALKDKNRAAQLFAETSRVMFGLPSFQLY
ncbi:MAG: DUF1800 domain-containing protein [Fimbriimonadaceae bacterium]|nr:DUF1800 domain-containing protein [Fimbriimonadaceae bacterium]